MASHRLDHLRIKQLRFVSLLASLGSLAATAERLSMSPSAASMMLKEIEGIFGAKLFADVVAARAGQHHVQHDERRLKLGDSGHGFIAAIARGGFVAFALQDFLQSEQDVRVVLDD